MDDHTQTGLAIANSIGTLALIGITAYYASLTRRLVRAQTDPFVVVYAENNEVAPMVDIVTDNIGQGLARDIRFEMIDSIPECMPAKGITADLGEPINSGILVDGIAALPPRGKRSVMWGSHEQIDKFAEGRRLRIACFFRRADGGRELRTDCALEYRSLAEATRRSSLGQIADELRSITDVLRQDRA